MSALALYLIFVKATLTSFSGLSSLPILHHDLVVQRHVLTESQLNAAVAVARMTPGPLGSYVVCAGYFAGGLPGAAAGYLAMITPAFVILVMLRWLGAHVDRPEIRRVISAVTLGAAGLIAATSIAVAKSAITGAETALLAIASLLVLTLTRLDTAWVIVAAAALGVAAALL